VSAKAATERGLSAGLLDRNFLTGSSESATAYRDAMCTAHEVVLEHLASRSRPYSGAEPTGLADALAEQEVCPEAGVELREVLREVGGPVLEHSIGVAHPACLAHLHCPPLVPALVAEALISAANQSMDSWDQSPAATFVEQRVVGWLCDLLGYGAAGDGVFTSGGTQSNLMGLLLARDRYARERLGWPAQKSGLPPEAERFRILCSEAAHFTVRQSAALLGLGERAVVPVTTDGEHRMSPEALDEKLRELRRAGLLPVAVIGTAGTTDFGSIDPLPELAERAWGHGAWFHVDAAYGGALALSERHRGKLAGIEASDSLAVDFHKQFYQPISAGAFLLRERGHFSLMKRHADYLNPEGDGVLNLVGKSLQTTRRFDALKLLVSLRALGREGFAAMIDHTLEVAAEAARMIREDPKLELANRPQIGAVVFRYLPEGDGSRADEINEEIRASLMRGGEAVVARTRVDHSSHLKLTIINPRTTVAHVAEILRRVRELGELLEGDHA
jgi:L-2,4-diaminobutyrate decarboxylase